MKKVFLLVLLPFSLFAQEFNEGTNVISAGIGFGGTFGNSYTYSNQTPGISVQYEKGIWPVGGPGVISLGGYLGIKSFKDDYSIGQYSVSQKWNYTIIGVRSAYHFNMVEVKKLDLYAGLMLSYNILSYKYTDNDASNTLVINGKYNSTLGLTLYGGGRYYLAENIAVFAELGYGVSYFTLGAAFRF
jgi:hypothetical protein